MDLYPSKPKPGRSKFGTVASLQGRQCRRNAVADLIKGAQFKQRDFDAQRLIGYRG
jgi:hypothetical protein